MTDELLLTFCWKSRELLSVNESMERGGEMVMVSDAQLLANRENAKKGGVKTDTGKAIVRLNALQHGLLCRDVLLPGENRDALNELRERFIAEFQPEGEVELMLVERMVSSYWRLGRALVIETGYLRTQLESYEPGAKIHHTQACGRLVNVTLGGSNRWLNLLRYETAIERQFYKALHELERLQMARKGARPPAPIAIDVDVSRGD